MSKVLSYLKPYRIQMGIAIFLMLVELVVELWHPLIMAKIIDDGIVQEDMSVVMTWGGIMIGLSLLAFAAGIANSFFSAFVSQVYGYDVRKSIFEKVQSFSFANFNKFPTSSLITRITNDVTQIQQLVFMGLRIMIRAPLLIVGGLIMALLVDVRLALILVVTIPALLIFILWIMNKAFSLFQTVQEKLDTVNGVMQENLAGIRLIKAFLRWKHEIKRFSKANEDLMDRTVNALRIIELTMPVLLFVMNVSILIVLWVGSIEINTGDTKVGEIVAIVNYATRVMFAFSVFSFILMNVSRARASAHRISDVLTTEIDLLDADTVDQTNQFTKGKVKFNNVSFQYPETNTLILKNISFEVESGNTIAILGATGSGKSSLFQLIPRLYDVNEGKIAIDNIDICKMKLEDLRKQIGFVPQEALLFTGSVKENIGWGKENATMDEIIQAAKDAQIHETIEKLPESYNTKIGQKGVNLSGGQKQRLSVARALIRKPKILLLDDSTSALDLKTEAKLLQALKTYSCTTFIITQKISTVMEADKILLLENGELLTQGNHEYLLEHALLYQQIYQSQFGEERLKHVK
jgi:ATP-binding cassette subfamily B multidrug efflux pump